MCQSAVIFNFTVGYINSMILFVFVMLVIVTIVTMVSLNHFDFHVSVVMKTSLLLTLSLFHTSPPFCIPYKIYVFYIELEIPVGNCTAAAVAQCLSESNKFVSQHLSDAGSSPACSISRNLNP